MNTRVRLAVLCAALTVSVLAVTGCATATPASTASANTSESPATPTPAPTKTDPASEAPSASPESPAVVPRTGEATADGFPGIEVGMPFLDAVAAAGIEVQGMCTWAGFGKRDGYQVIIARVADGAENDPVVEVSAQALQGETAIVGPRTAAGIGIGSTVAEAIAEYPAAEDVQGTGGIHHLKVETSSLGSLFLTYADGGSVIWGVTATSREMPSYEFCG